MPYLIFQLKVRTFGFLKQVKDRAAGFAGREDCLHGRREAHRHYQRGRFHRHQVCVVPVIGVDVFAMMRLRFREV